MRNFKGGYKNHNSSNFSRNDRRTDREGRYQSGDDFRKPPNKSFNRSFTDNKRPRRDYDDHQTNRHSYNQDRRENHGGNRSYGGNDRSFHDRSFRDHSKSDRSYRNQTPPRSRDRDGHTESRYNRSNDSRNRQRSFSPPSAASKFRRQNDYDSSPVKSRPARGRILSSARRGTIRTGGGVSRIVRGRNDLRSGLIAKRTGPAIRSKEYAKKIRQARMRLNESESSKKTTEPKSPTKENDDDTKNEDNDEEFLDVANDVDFEEDDDELAAEKNALKPKETENKEKPSEEDKIEDSETKTSEVEMTDEASKADKDKASSKRSASEDKDKKKSDEIDLTCIHCTTKCMTVQDYRNHLTRRTHVMAMRKVSIKLRMKLGRLRKIQRDKQLEIEARLKNVENIPSKYCPICKLYFRQSKIEHRESEDHKKIRNFLRPYCKICRTQLPMPMKYEIHRCTVEHLKRKAKNQESSDDEIDLNDLDIGDFKTVDSIGAVDGEETDADDEDFEASGEIVGKEFINKIEVHYCSLCREYLSRRVEDEKSITEHCKSKKHLKWYYQCRKKEAKQPDSAKDKDFTKEIPKEDVTSTSVPENIKSVKKSVEKSTEIKKDVNPAKEKGDDDKRDSDIITLTEPDDMISQDDEKEKDDEKSKIFTRYFEM